MYYSRFRIIFWVVLVVMLIPVQASVSAAASWAGSYAAPARAMLDVDTETPTPTETETSTPTETQVETETPTPTTTETPTPTVTETQADTETPIYTATPTETVTAVATETETTTPTETATPTPTATATIISFPKVVSIKRANLDPTNKSSVAFVVTFTESVTGIRTTAPFGDFSLTKSGLTGTSIISMTGSGNTYLVIVNTGRGIGTIRLNLLDNDTIKDIDGNPLGGTGIGNGNFLSGEVYSVQNTKVSSISLMDPGGPTSVGTVRFKLKFNESVTGVNKTPPFGDFSLTTTKLTGVSIVSVTGQGAIYIITVNIGSGINGTIRLNVKDDDSIKDASGTPLGGVGKDNGRYTNGPSYSINTVPGLTSPRTNITYLNPAYEWFTVKSATKYQYDVFKGTQLIYTGIVPATQCNGMCSVSSPTALPGEGSYQWRVRALIGSIWKGYSAYALFTVLIPKAGFWKGETDFYVTPDNKFVTQYKFYIDVPACHIYGQTLIINAKVAIDKYGTYSYSNNFTHVYFNGTFLSSQTDKGYFALNGYYLPGCGPIFGSFDNEPHKWQNSNQPTSMHTYEFTLIPNDPVVHTRSIFQAR